MPDAPRVPSAFALWMEDALRSWILQLGALAVAAAVAGLYLLGFLSEDATGAFVSVAGPLAAAVLAARPGLVLGRDPAGRALAVTAAVAALLLSAGPSLATIVPGGPLFGGEMAEQGTAVPVPAGVSGRVRVLVSGHLREAGDPEVSFRIAGTAPAVDGRLERNWSTARVGRGARARVAHDHLADWYEATIPAGTAELRLERLQGQPAGPLTLAVHRELVPRWLLLAAMGLTLVAAAAADARLGSRSEVAVPVAMALAFGLLVDENATPLSAVGPALGGALLGAMLGALAGALASWLGRRLLPARWRAGKRG